MVYQEQVMQIAQVIGGYTLGGADLLRRAMGKKKPEEMATHRDDLRRRRGQEQRARRKRARRCSSTCMEKFAGYGFNRSHCRRLCAHRLSDGVRSRRITRRRSWRPTCRWSWTTPTRCGSFHDDAIALGLAILPPDVNASNYRFEPVDAKQIRYGLGGVKGTGAVGDRGRSSPRATPAAPFRDLFDFCRRVDKRAVNRRAVEALVRAGAFDAIEPRRAALLASVGIALEAARARRSANAAQVSLFGEDAARTLGRRSIATRDWTDAERLQHEKSARRLLPVRASVRAATPAELAPLVRTSLADLAPRHDRVLVAGIVTQMRVQSEPARQDGLRHARRRSRFARRSWSTTRRSTACAALLRDDQLVIAEVKVTQRMTDDGEIAGPAHHRRERLRPGDDPQALRAGTPARLQRQRVGRRRSRKYCSRSVRATSRSPCAIATSASAATWCCRRTGAVNLDDALIDRLREWLAPENVQVLY